MVLMAVSRNPWSSQGSLEWNGLQNTRESRPRGSIRRFWVLPSLLRNISDLASPVFGDDGGKIQYKIRLSVLNQETQQALYLRMIEIANKYSPEFQNDYVNAAQLFRLPFWDYYRPRGGPVEFPGVVDQEKTSFPYDYSLPRVLTEKTISVRIHPHNELKQLPHNPFRFYEFQPGSLPPDEWDLFAEDVIVTLSNIYTETH